MPTVSELRGSVSLDPAPYEQGLRRVEETTERSAKDIAREWEWLGKQSAQAARDAEKAQADAAKAIERANLAATKQIAAEWAWLGKQSGETAREALRAQQQAVRETTQANAAATRQIAAEWAYLGKQAQDAARATEQANAAATHQIVAEWEWAGRQSAASAREAEREREDAGRQAVQAAQQQARQWASAEQEAARMVEQAHREVQREAEQSARAAAQAQVKAAQTVREGWQAVGSLGGQLSIGVTAPILLAGHAALESAMDIEQMKVGLTNLTGSAVAAEREYSELLALSRKPGMDLPSAVMGATRLQAVGFSAAKAEEAIKQFGNAVARSGGGAEKLEAVTVQLAQMSAKGKVVAQDLKPIIEAAPAIANVIKEAFGTVDSQEIEKQLKAAGKSSADFVDLLIGRLGKLPRAGTTARNELRNSAKDIELAMGEVGKAILPVELAFVKGVVPAIQSTAHWFDSLTTTQKQWVIGTAGVAAGVGPMLFGLGQIVTMVGSIKSVTALLTIAKETATIAEAAHAAAVAADTGAEAANTASLAANTAALEANAIAAGEAAGARALLAGAGGAGGFLGTGLGAVPVVGAVVATAAAAGAVGYYAAGKPLSEAVDRGGQQTRDVYGETPEQRAANANKGFARDVGLRRDLNAEDAAAAARSHEALFDRPQVKAQLARMMREQHITEAAARKQFLAARGEGEAEQSRQQAGAGQSPAASGTGGLAFPHAGDGPKAAKRMSDEAYAYQLQSVATALEKTPEETKARDEAKALIPLLRQRQADLKAMAGEQEAGSKERLALATQERQLEQQVLQLGRAASREEASARKKVGEERKKQSAQINAARVAYSDAQINAAKDIDVDEEGNRARATADSAIPAIQAKVQELTRQQQALQPMLAASAEAQEQYQRLEKEKQAANVEMNRLDRDAIKEQVREQKQALKDREEAVKAHFAANKEIARAMVEALPEKEQAAGTLKYVVPALQQEQAFIVSELQSGKLSAAEYDKEKAAYWNLEGDILKARQHAVDVEKQAQEKAKEAARKVTRDAISLREAETSLIEARAKNLETAFGLTPQRAAQAIIPALVRQFQALAKPEAGEDEQEKIKRQVEMENFAGRIMGDAKKAHLNPRVVYAELSALARQEEGKLSQQDMRTLARQAGVNPRAFQQDIDRYTKTHTDALQGHAQVAVKPLDAVAAAATHAADALNNLASGRAVNPAAALTSGKASAPTAAAGRGSRIGPDGMIPRSAFLAPMAREAKDLPFQSQLNPRVIDARARPGQDGASFHEYGRPPVSDWHPPMALDQAKVSVRTLPGQDLAAGFSLGTRKVSPDAVQRQQVAVAQPQQGPNVLNFSFPGASGSFKREMEDPENQRIFQEYFEKAMDACRRRRV